MARFVSLEEEEIQRLILDKDSKSTKLAVEQGKKAFLEYLYSKGKNEKDVYNMTVSEVDNILFTLYPSIRKRSGELMKLNTLKSIKYGISV